MVISDLCLVMLTFYEYSIDFIACDSYVFVDNCLADETFVGSAENAIFFILLDLVKGYNGKSTIDLYADIILINDISRYLGFAC